MTTRLRRYTVTAGTTTTKDQGPSYHYFDLAVTLGVYRDWREALGRTLAERVRSKGVATQAAEIATMNNDANRLEQLAKVIATGLETFVAVGNALL